MSTEDRSEINSWHTMEAPTYHGLKRRMLPRAITLVRASQAAIETPTTSLPPSSSLCTNISFKAALGRGMTRCCNPDCAKRVGYWLCYAEGLAQTETVCAAAVTLALGRPSRWCSGDTETLPDKENCTSATGNIYRARRPCSSRWPRRDAQQPASEL